LFPLNVRPVYPLSKLNFWVWHVLRSLANWKRENFLLFSFPMAVCFFPNQNNTKREQSLSEESPALGVSAPSHDVTSKCVSFEWCFYQSKYEKWWKMGRFGNKQLINETSLWYQKFRSMKSINATLHCYGFHSVVLLSQT